jgi:hypothetical protein
MVTDVTSLVSVTSRNRLGLVTVLNRSGLTVEGPVYLVLFNLPRKVRLRGAVGTTVAHGPLGSPFEVEAVTLLPGGFVDFVVRFSNPRHKAIHLRTEVFAGPGVV